MSLTPDDVQRLLDTLKQQHDAYYRLAGLQALPAWAGAEVRRLAKLQEMEAQCKMLAQGSKTLAAKLAALRTLYPEPLDLPLVHRLLMADYVPDEEERYLVDKIALALIAHSVVLGEGYPPLALLDALCQGNRNREWLVKHRLAKRLHETVWSSSWIDVLLGI